MLSDRTFHSLYKNISALEGLRYFIDIISTWRLAQFSLYVHKGGLRHHAFHFIPFLHIAAIWIESGRGMRFPALLEWGSKISFAFMICI